MCSLKWILVPRCKLCIPLQGALGHHENGSLVLVVVLVDQVRLSLGVVFTVVVIIDHVEVTCENQNQETILEEEVCMPEVGIVHVEVFLNEQIRLIWTLL
jgi:hypothetical protein